MLFGDRLKQVRLEKGYFQEDVANAAGVSRQAIARYENNERQPDFVILNNLADFLNVSTDYLLGRTNIKDPISFFNEFENCPPAIELIESLYKLLDTLNNQNLDFNDPINDFINLTSNYKNNITNAVDEVLYNYLWNKINK